MDSTKSTNQHTVLHCCTNIVILLSLLFHFPKTSWEALHEVKAVTVEIMAKLNRGLVRRNDDDRRKLSTTLVL